MISHRLSDWLMIDYGSTAPDPAARFLGAFLGLLVLPFRVMRPVERATIGNKPLSQVRAGRTELTCSHRASVLILPGRRAYDGAWDGVKEPSQGGSSHSTALIVQAV